MRIKNIISITEARKKIFDIADDVQQPGNYYILTQKGNPKVILMSTEDFETLKETMEVMREFPNLDKEVRQIDKAVKSGEYKKWAKLEDILSEKNYKNSYQLADKSKNYYGMGRKNRKRSAKRIR